MKYSAIDLHSNRNVVVVTDGPRLACWKSSVCPKNSIV